MTDYKIIDNPQNIIIESERIVEAAEIFTVSGTVKNNGDKNWDFFG